MTLLQTLIAFVVALGVLVVVHEWGHYFAARLCGVKVLRFSVGMGKIIYSRRFGPDQTEWAISALPLGGYVKMLDAREVDVSALPPEDIRREFTRQSVWKRIAIVAAGPVSNFILAIIIFAGLYSYGIPEPMPALGIVSEKTPAFDAGLRGGEIITAVNDETIQSWSDLRWKLLQLVIEKAPAQLQVHKAKDSLNQPVIEDVITLKTDSLSASDLEGDFLQKLGMELAYPKPVLGKILSEGPAMRAGLREGDLILKINNKEINNGLAFITLIQASPGEKLDIVGIRAQQMFSLSVVPETYIKDGHTFGRIKAEVPLSPKMVTVSYPLLKAFSQGVGRTWDTSVLTIKMLGKMLIGEVSWKNITGPITIADYAGQTARVGIVSYLTFIAFISISLGVMNLLPIPVLDGGLLLYYSLEVLTGRPVSERFGEIAQRAGVGILVTLMAVAVFNDIMRLMP